MTHEQLTHHVQFLETCNAGFVRIIATLERENAALRTELTALRAAYERMAEKAAARKEAQP